MMGSRRRDRPLRIGITAASIVSILLSSTPLSVVANGEVMDILRASLMTIVSQQSDISNIEQHDQQELHRRRAQNYNQGCPNNLSTPLNPTSGSYGNVFTVRSRPGGPPVLVTSLDFYTDRTYQVEYEVWTMDGAYDSTFGDLSQWTQISAGRVTGEGQTRPTPIPETNFQSVQIGGNGSFRSFYVTLTTADIRYRAGEGTADGQIVYAESDELQIFEGVGVILYPMPNDGINYKKPRNFLGNIHYTSGLTCDPTPFPTTRPTLRPTTRPTPWPVGESQQPVTTRVMYTFSLQHPPRIQQEAMLEQVDASINQGLDQLLYTFGSDLNYYAQYDDLKIVGVLSFPAAEDPAACSPAYGNVCTDIATTVSASHLPSVSRIQVRHTLLQHISDLTSFIPYDSAYTGSQSVQADMLVKLKGVPLREMSDAEKALLENVMLGFLSERLGEDYDLTGAEITDQIVSAGAVSSNGVAFAGRHRKHAEEPSGRRREVYERFLQASSAGTLDVSVRITGENRNPNKRELEEKIEDTIDSGGASFSRDLAEAAQNDPVVSKSAYFSKVEEVSSKPKDGVDSPPNPAPGSVDPNSNGGGSSNLGIIIGAAVGGVVALVAAVFLFMKWIGFGKKKKSSEYPQLRQIDSAYADDGGRGKNAMYDDMGDKDRMSGYDGYGSGGGGGSYDPKAQAKMKEFNTGSVYGTPGAVAAHSKTNMDTENKLQYKGAAGGRSSQKKMDMDSKLSYNGASAGRLSARQLRPSNSRSASKLGEKLALNGAGLPPQESRRNMALENKLAYNGAPPGSPRSSSRHVRSNSRGSLDEVERQLAGPGGRPGSSQRGSSRHVRSNSRGSLDEVERQLAGPGGRPGSSQRGSSRHVRSNSRGSLDEVERQLAGPGGRPGSSQRSSSRHVRSNSRGSLDEVERQLAGPGGRQRPSSRQLNSQGSAPRNLGGGASGPSSTRQKRQASKSSFHDSRGSLGSGRTNSRGSLGSLDSKPRQQPRRSSKSSLHSNNAPWQNSGLSSTSGGSGNRSGTFTHVGEEDLHYR